VVESVYVCECYHGDWFVDARLCGWMRTELRRKLVEVISIVREDEQGNPGYVYILADSVKTLAHLR
jgi:hypothetical protein